MVPYWLNEPFPGGSDGKESACIAGDLGLIPGSGRSPEEGNGNPLQYSCLENPMDKEAWRATVHSVAKSWTQLSNFTFFLSFFLYWLNREESGQLEDRNGSEIFTMYICVSVCVSQYISTYLSDHDTCLKIVFKKSMIF